MTCRVLKLARQPYYRWLAAPVTDAELEEAYRANALFDAHTDDPEFGYRFLLDEARDAGEPMAERTAWRICSSNGWWSAFGKPKRGKAKKPGPPVHDDLCAVVDKHGVIRHEFTADGPNELWIGDITEQIVGMVIAMIMLVVGSNIARAFALVGALSVVRFRNAIKETRDVGFIFLVMAVGMAAGTRFYLLAAVAAVAICLVIVLMYRFNWFKLDVQRQVVKVQVPPGAEYHSLVEDALVAHCSEFELVSTDSARGGALAELSYTAQLKKGSSSADLIAALNQVNSGQRVTVLTGYDQTDL